MSVRQLFLFHIYIFSIKNGWLTNVIECMQTSKEYEDCASACDMNSSDYANCIQRCIYGEVVTSIDLSAVVASATAAGGSKSDFFLFVHLSSLLLPNLDLCTI